MPIVESARPVVGGVDTHLDVHVAAAVDSAGALLGVRSFPTTPAGYHALGGWLASFGRLERVGVEGTGAYGVGLARHLAAAGVAVVEVDRPNRQERRRNGKSDELDAIEAARAALSGRARGQAKSGTGSVEALRALLVAKRSARSIRIKSTGQLRHLVITAPDDLRARLSGLTTKALVATSAALRVRCGTDPARYGTKTAIVTPARRVQAINVEIAALDRQLDRLVRTTAPQLLDIYGVGVRRDPPRRCRRQRGAHPQRSRMGATVRCRAHPRRFRQDQHPPAPQPGRKPSSEPRVVADRPHPTRTRRPPNRRLHATPTRRRPH
jgi:transposase